MTRLKVEEGASTALHVVADALHCTSVGAEALGHLEAGDLDYNLVFM